MRRVLGRIDAAIDRLGLTPEVLAPEPPARRRRFRARRHARPLLCRHHDDRVGDRLPPSLRVAGPPDPRRTRRDRASTAASRRCRAPTCSGSDQAGRAGTADCRGDEPRRRARVKLVGHRRAAHRERQTDPGQRPAPDPGGTVDAAADRPAGRRVQRSGRQPPGYPVHDSRPEPGHHVRRDPALRGCDGHVHREDPARPGVPERTVHYVPGQARAGRGHRREVPGQSAHTGAAGRAQRRPRRARRSRRRR